MDIDPLSLTLSPMGDGKSRGKMRYDILVLRIPPSLERMLNKMFPNHEEREQFIADAIQRAIEEENPLSTEEPVSVGGTLHLFTDGGSRGNPGQAAIACILEDPQRGEIIREHEECIGIETNNVAEYRALIEGLRLARLYHPNRLICHLDSQLIVRQLNGQYRVKMSTLRPLFDEIKELGSLFADISFVHIPREDNFRADAMVNKALDACASCPPSPS